MNYNQEQEYAKRHQENGNQNRYRNSPLIYLHLIFEISSLMNWFFSKFKLNFYCLCSLQKCSSNFEKFSSLNWKFKLKIVTIQVQIDRGLALFDAHHIWSLEYSNITMRMCALDVIKDWILVYLICIFNHLCNFTNQILFHSP